MPLDKGLLRRREERMAGVVEKNGRGKCVKSICGRRDISSPALLFADCAILKSGVALPGFAWLCLALPGFAWLCLALPGFAWLCQAHGDHYPCRRVSACVCVCVCVCVFVCMLCAFPVCVCTCSG